MKVFVYGTLKKGYMNNYLLADATYIDDAVTKGNKWGMDNYIYYPAVFPDTSRTAGYIYGEIWEIDKSILSNLDRLEGYPSFYTRSIIKVVDTDGKEHEAIMYHYAHKPANSIPQLPNEDGVIEWNR